MSETAILSMPGVGGAIAKALIGFCSIETAKQNIVRLKDELSLGDLDPNHDIARAARMAQLNAAIAITERVKDLEAAQGTAGEGFARAGQYQKVIDELKSRARKIDAASEEELTKLMPGVGGDHVDAAVRLRLAAEFGGDAPLSDHALRDLTLKEVVSIGGEVGHWRRTPPALENEFQRFDSDFATCIAALLKNPQKAQRWENFFRIWLVLQHAKTHQQVAHLLQAFSQLEHYTDDRDRIVAAIAGNADALASMMVQLSDVIDVNLAILQKITALQNETKERDEKVFLRLDEIEELIRNGAIKISPANATPIEIEQNRLAIQRIAERSVEAFKEFYETLETAGREKAIAFLKSQAVLAEHDASKQVQEAQEKLWTAEDELADSIQFWRDIATLAHTLLNDDAIEAWQRVITLAPDDFWAHIELARCLKNSGKNALPLALEKLDRALTIAPTTRDRAAALDVIGDIKAAQGDLKGALSAYQNALDIADALAKQDPSHTERQRDLSVSHEKIGDIKRAQGDLKGALNAYQNALDIRETLAKQDPSHAERQRDLSVCYNKIGDIKEAQGDLNGALSAYQNALDIADALAKHDPSHAERQRDLFVSHTKIGNIKAAQGDLKGALSAYQNALHIADALAKQDPSHAERQRDLSVSYEKIGDIKAAQGDLKGALSAYQNALDIRETLAKQDPSHGERQRDLFVSLTKIGKIKIANEDLTGALKSHLNALSIADILARLDPSHAGRQQDLLMSYGNMGMLEMQRGNEDEAIRHFEAALAIAEQLVALSPTHAQYQQDLEDVQSFLAQLRSD